MPTNTTLALKDLAGWLRQHSDDLLACDPSLNEDSQARFFGLQREGDELEKAIEEAGYTYEQVYDAAEGL